MGKTGRSLLAAAVLVAIVVVAALPMLSGSPVDAPASEPRDRAAGTAAQSELVESLPHREDNAVADPAERREAIVDRSSTGPLVECQVMRGFDATYPGARVRLEFFEDREAPGAPEFEVVLVADGEGLVSTWIPQLTATGLVRLSSDEKGLASRPATALAIPGQDQVPSTKLYIFPLDRTVEGVVQDTAGQPIGGARVAAFLNPDVAKRQPQRSQRARRTRGRSAFSVLSVVFVRRVPGPHVPCDPARVWLRY